MRTRSLYLVDSSVWIRYLGRGKVPTLKSRLDALLMEQACVMTGIVLHEVLAGAHDEHELQELERLFMSLKFLPSPNEVWAEAGRLHFRLVRKGLSLPHGDVLIAALAVRYACTVLHTDRHFDLIARHSPLRVERIG